MTAPALAAPAAFTDSVGDMTVDLLQLPANHFRAALADPPWRFDNATGKVAPEHQRLRRYSTMTLDEIHALSVERVMAETAHLYLWCPNTLLPNGLRVMAAWGFTYKSNIVWHKIRKDGGSDGRGVGFYFRNVTELLLFGVRGKNARTLAAGRTQVNFIETRKREHSRKPDEQYALIEACSPGPFLELFARASAQSGLFPCRRQPWVRLGDEAGPEHTSPMSGPPPCLANVTAVAGQRRGPDRRRRVRVAVRPLSPRHHHDHADRMTMDAAITTTGLEVAFDAAPLPFCALRRAYYRAIAVDVPSRFKSYKAIQSQNPGSIRSNERHYSTMSFTELAALPVKDLASGDGCHLFYWTSGPFLPQAIALISTWGFKYSTRAFTWVKLRPSYDPNQLRLTPLVESDLNVGLGLTTRHQTELVLLGRRGNARRISKRVREVIFAPVREHSRKPDEFYPRVHQYCQGPYVELFARERRPGWDTFGNEVDKFLGEVRP